MCDTFPETPHRSPISIIGCGCLERGDDAAGILVARRLRAMGVDAVEQEGLFELAAADNVVIIDAMVSGAAPGTIRVWDDLSWKPLAEIRLRASTHGFGVAEALDLACALNRLPRRLRIVGIEGARFETGAPVSPDVSKGITTVVDQVARWALAASR